MTDTDTPAGGTPSAEGVSGRPTEQRPSEDALAALPEKVRVHALARMVGTSSRDLLATLTRLGVGARSAQSSVDRAVVARVIDEMFGTPAAAAPAADTPGIAAAEPVTPSEATPSEAAPSEAPTTPSRAAPFAAPMFLAPGSSSTDDEDAPARPRRRRAARSAGTVTPQETPETPGVPASETATGIDGSESPAAETPAAAAPVTDDGARSDDGSRDEGSRDDSPRDDSDDDEDDGGRRRRRRGRRGRGRGRGPADDNDDAEGDGTETSEDQGDDAGSDDDADGAEGADGAKDGDADDDEQGSGGSRRRRRRRRRSSDSDGEASGDSSDEPVDPPNTVVHVRDRVERPEGGRSSNDEVRGVKGSTRLEAKRQRRRDGRDAGRRRPSILSESEFLARREAVERTMVVRQQAGRSQIGVLEDGVLVEHFVAGDGQNSMVGNVYLGRVQNVLPSMEAAFVDIGRGRNAVLYAGEVNWDASGLEGKQRKIEQALSSGDQVLVQVTKDPVGHKGARLTTQISLPGRFLVYVPAGGATGISRKLPDTERKRLKEILKRIVPDESGVIIRTAAEGVSEEDLERDVRRLTAQWEAIDRTASETGKKGSKGPSLVYEEPDLLIRVVRDMFNEDFSSLVVSGERAWETLEGYVSHVAPELGPRLTRHTGPEDVFAAHRIDEQLIKALDRKVWLPSGGTLVIDRTEAMTVIDVNTGKFTGSGGNLEETVTRNNLEAAEETVRQLRLRDIGGMIVIDFIDMVLESNRDLVLRRLTECLGRDRTRHQVSEVTSLGLVQMTRKRVGQGLLDEFSTTCEHCRGRGVIVTTEPVMGHDHGSPVPSGTGQPGNGQQQSGGNGTSTPAASGENGSGGSGNGGSGSGRRRGRGRRGTQSEGGSPATVAAASGLVDTLPGAGSETAPSTEDDEAAAPVEDAAETEVALEAGLAETSTEVTGDDTTGDVPSATSEVEPDVVEAVEAEVALETDLADHPPAAETPEAPANETPARDPSRPRRTRPRTTPAEETPARPAGSRRLRGSPGRSVGARPRRPRPRHRRSPPRRRRCRSRPRPPCRSRAAGGRRPDPLARRSAGPTGPPTVPVTTPRPRAPTPPRSAPARADPTRRPRPPRRRQPRPEAGTLDGCPPGRCPRHQCAAPAPTGRAPNHRSPPATGACARDVRDREDRRQAVQGRGRRRHRRGAARR